MVNQILPQLVKRFREKSRDYGYVFYDLGLAGQFSDMHRKHHKLQRAMWDGEELKGEQLDEVLADLFGNILISLYLHHYGNFKATHPGSARSQPSSGQDTDTQGTAPGSQKGGEGQQEADAVRQSAPPFDLQLHGRLPDAGGARPPRHRTQDGEPGAN